MIDVNYWINIHCWFNIESNWGPWVHEDSNTPERAHDDEDDYGNDDTDDDDDYDTIQYNLMVIMMQIIMIIMITENGVMTI